MGRCVHRFEKPSTHTDTQAPTHTYNDSEPLALERVGDREAADACHTTTGLSIVAPVWRCVAWLHSECVLSSASS